MRDEDDGAARGFKLRDALATFALEGSIAYGQHFIDEQHIRRCVNSDGESQAHLHSCAVSTQWALDEWLQFRKVDNGLEALRHLTTGQTGNHATNADVLAPTELRMEADAQSRAARRCGH